MLNKTQFFYYWNTLIYRFNAIFKKNKWLLFFIFSRLCWPRRRTLYASSLKTFRVCPSCHNMSPFNWAVWQWQPSSSWIKRVSRVLLSCSHASVRAGPDPETDAAAGDGGSSAKDGGDVNGAGRLGERPGELGRKTAALQNDQTQPEAQPRDLLSGGFLRSSQHARWRTGSPAPWCGRCEAHCAEERRPGPQQ